MEPGADILLRLSAQRALLGAVTPNLRSFSVEMNGGTVACQAVFEEAPAAEEIDLIQSAGAEIIADFVDGRSTSDLSSAPIRRRPRLSSI
ncbi:hypothetical protein [Brevundimonas denitrificans]|uniref:hypothetical protein n=1 Tax=Brevundimonas denitrificans TaxID=1443434 RepID=UPI00223BE24A|nr:hypothetical protein [Brevundimonas denitrificans]